MTDQAKRLYLQAAGPNDQTEEWNEEKAFERFAVIIAKPVYCERLDLFANPAFSLNVPVV